ncbi:hypothetical protein [Paenibacillus sp. PL2-23]|uniref:hypothetical protein n=1 Tax=Paenibacillus sp. PL2-23 TaxID=2100729 RepID=UPI00349EDDAC
MTAALNLDGKRAELKEISADELGHEGLWRMIAAQTLLSQQAKVDQYEAVVANDGQLRTQKLHLVDRDQEGRYVHVEAFYEAVDQTVLVKRYTTESWVQHSRSIAASYFFERVESLGLTRLKPDEGEYNLVGLELMGYGAQVHYGIVNGHTFGVDEDGAYAIEVNVNQPVQGIWLYACGIRDNRDPFSFSTCDNQTDYLFDIEGGRSG